MKRKPRKAGTSRRPLVWLLWLAVGAVSGGLGVYFFGPAAGRTGGERVSVEEPPLPVTPPPAPARKAPADFEPAGGQGRGAIALVLDGLDQMEDVRRLERAEFHGPVALAVAPGSPVASEVTALVKQKGWDLLVAPVLKRDVVLEAGGEAGLAAAWERAEALALRKGSAIVVAHARPETIEFLGKRLLGLEKRGLMLIGLSELAD